MHLRDVCLLIAFAASWSSHALFAQPAPAPAPERLIRMSGSLPEAAGETRTLRFAVYDTATGGSPLWQETQTVHVDSAGNYTAFVGATSADGLPLDLLATGAPRWLAVEGPGDVVAPRTLLAAVPYAVAAATAVNAATLGGRPATDFQLTPAARRGNDGPAHDASASADLESPAVNSGNVNFIGKFTNSIDLGNSQLYDTGANIGLGTIAPLDKFHVQFSNAGGTQTGLAVQNTSSAANAYSGMLFYDHTGALRQFQGYNNSTGEYRINNISPSASINFLLGGDSKFRVAPGGFVALGGGSLTPAAKLHMFGQTFPERTVRGTAFGGSLSAPTAAMSGTILVSVEGAGYNGTTFTGERGFIDIRTTQTWTSGAAGTAIVFATTANNTTFAVERATIAENGYVGIGTLLPAVPLDVNSSTTLSNGGVFSLFSAGSTGLATSSGNVSNVSIRGSGWLVGAGIAAVSDARIKTIVGRSDAARDLDLLNRIEVTDYSHIDGMERGGGPQKKVVAQQVEQVYPQAVSTMTDVVPDIFRKAPIRNGWVSLSTDLEAGDRVRLITQQGHKAVHEVLEVAEGRFRTDFTEDVGQVFVYGREVKDFRVVDYDAISMLNVSATQELARRLEQQTAETADLKDQIAQLRAALATAVEALNAARNRR